MRNTLACLLLFIIAGQSWALTVTIEAKSDGTDKPSIAGTTNLPDGISLMITLRRKESGYMAQDKAIIKGGSFRAGPFSQKGTGLNPGTYLLEVTMPLASMQPPPTWPIIGNDGANLQGPFVLNSKLGGKVIEYRTIFKVGDGQTSIKKDQSSSAEFQTDTHAWWLQSCKDTCNITQNIATSKNQSFNFERCYYKCVADEPKKK